MTNDEADQKSRLIDEHVSQLGEHFENVQIFCNALHDDGQATRTFARGSGNWCARYGQIREWVDFQKAKTAEEGRRRQAEQDEA